MTQEIKPIKIKGVAFWAMLNRVNELSGKYQVDIGQLSDGAVKALEGMGVDAKTKGDEKGFFITCKSARPIRAYDAEGEIIPADVLIGNGSEVEAVISAFQWKFKNKTGYSPSLVKLVVKKLNKYVAPADAHDGEEAL